MSCATKTGATRATRDLCMLGNWGHTGSVLDHCAQHPISVLCLDSLLSPGPGRLAPTVSPHSSPRLSSLLSTSQHTRLPVTRSSPSVSQIAPPSPFDASSLNIASLLFGCNIFILYSELFSSKPSRLESTLPSVRRPTYTIRRPRSAWCWPSPSNSRGQHLSIR